MKKTLNLGFGRRPQQSSNLFLNIYSSKGKVRLHTKNQPPILPNSGDSYEEDLKIGIWKTTSKHFKFFLQYFLYLGYRQAACQKSDS